MRKISRKFGALAVLGILILVSFIPISFAAPVWNDTATFANTVDVEDDGSYYISIDDDGDTGDDQVFAVLKHGAPGSGTELFRIQEDGKVGIGTTSPDVKLTIIDASVDPKVRVGESTSVSGVFSWDVSENELRMNSYNHNYPINLGNHWLYLDTSGNVGIGTADPDYNLEVYGSGYTFLAVTTDTNGAPTLRLKNDARDWYVRNDGSDGDQFKIIERVANEERLVIDTSGNVGIGTSSPQSTLHVDCVMRLEPQSSAPSGGKGDLYVDTSGNLYVHDGSSWNQVAFA